MRAALYAAGMKSLTRRGLVVSVVALVAGRSLPARAQVLSGTDCGVGFVDGLVQLGAGCQLTPPGLGSAVAPPSHLVALSQVADSSTSTDATPPQSGGRRQRIKARRHRRFVLARSRHHHRRTKGH